MPSKQLCSSTPTRTEQNVKKRFGPSHPPPGQRNHVKCFNCGGMGHLARECKWRTKRGSVEQELRPKPVNHNTRLSTITANPHYPTSEKEQNVGRGSLEGRVAKLRQQLQEAEVEEALERVHSISSPDAKDNPHLGPIIYLEVQLEGIPVQALLDTGSPATIVSLEFLIEARWKTKPPHLTREKWEEDFKKMLKSPAIMLQNNGGDRLNVVEQTQVAISRGDYSQMAVVQVQKGAPVPLLIGTNLQPQLGFLFLQCTTGGMATNLLDRQCVQVKAPSALSPSQGGVHTLSQPEAQPTATVHLLHAVRVPAQHSRLVQAKIEGNKGTRQVYFEAAQNELAKRGLIVEDGMVEPNPDGNIALAIQNHSLSPVHLEENQ